MYYIFADAKSKICVCFKGTPLKKPQKEMINEKI